MTPPDGVALDGWMLGEHTHDGVTHPTYRRGSGPGVVVISEIPGITPSVLAFAEEVVAHGHTVVLPVLFGTPGAAPTAGAMMRSIAQACVSREFTILAAGRTSPWTITCAPSGGLTRIRQAASSTSSQEPGQAWKRPLWISSPPSPKGENGA